jgi:hypothetical protein
MYLVELSPGMEMIYGSLSEFTDAVRRGEVTPDARVFHRARSQWLPVTEHPKYREVIAALSAPRFGPARKEWTFLPAKSGREPVVPVELPLEPGPEAEPVAVARPARPEPRRGWRRALVGMLGRRSS